MATAANQRRKEKVVEAEHGVPNQADPSTTKAVFISLITTGEANLIRR